MWRFYGLDFRSLWTGGLTFRQVKVLVEKLPADAATVREASGPAASWSATEYLLAHVIDELRAANWLYSCAHTEKGKPMPDQPEPFKRPYVDTTKSQGSVSPVTSPAPTKRFATTSELAAFIQKVNRAT